MDSTRGTVVPLHVDRRKLGHMKLQNYVAGRWVEPW
jgi:hypothetical protein